MSTLSITKSANTRKAVKKHKFKGKLSHTSPTKSSKITNYFVSKTDDKNDEEEEEEVCYQIVPPTEYAHSNCKSDSTRVLRERNIENRKNNVDCGSVDSDDTEVHWNCISPTSAFSGLTLRLRKVVKTKTKLEDKFVASSEKKAPGSLSQNSSSKESCSDASEVQEDKEIDDEPNDNTQNEQTVDLPKQSQSKVKNGKSCDRVKQSERRQSTLTNYFPVRRSSRKTETEKLREKQKYLEDIILGGKDEGLEIVTVEGKGRGLISERSYTKGDFVVEYAGELIDMETARKREVLYGEDENTGCYMYYFKYKNEQYCIDATPESGRKGRLLNHSRNGNLCPKTIEIKGVPRLVLIAKQDIPLGSELTYDYGDRRRDALVQHPWLAL